MSCRRLQWVVVTLVMAVIGFNGNPAGAGILEDTAYALPGFQGSRDFAASFFFNEVYADFDFAAFAPVESSSYNFDAFLAEYGIVFDSGVPDDHYVYAYQAHVLESTSPNAEMVTVGTVFSGSVGGVAPSFVPLSAYGDGVGENGNEEPLLTSYQGSPATSALWRYVEAGAGTLSAGEWTAIMYFSSTHPPTWDSAQINAGLASGKSNLQDLINTGVPSPSPEPSSLLMLVIGAALLAIGRRRRPRP